MSADQQVYEVEEPSNVDEAISTYFKLGTTYTDMMRLLEENDGVSMGMTTLKRRISILKLERKSKLKVKVKSSKVDFKKAMRRMQREAGCQTDSSKAERLLMSRCGFKVPLKEIRSELSNSETSESVGKQDRASMRVGALTLLGPNYIWEVVNYDHLSSYGLSISGCVDKFSCRMVWLELMTSERRDPDVIMRYYLDAIETVGGCPSFLKSELEIENGMMSAAHCSLRQESEDRCHVRDIFSDVYMKRLIDLWDKPWIKAFEELVQSGAFVASDTVHRAILSFTFAALMRRDLSIKMKEWNVRVFRKWRTPLFVMCTPNELYHNPPPGFPEKKQPFLPETLRELRSCTVTDLTEGIRIRVHEKCRALVESGQLPFAITREDGMQLYLHLRAAIQTIPYCLNSSD